VTLEHLVVKLSEVLTASRSFVYSKNIFLNAESDVIEHNPFIQAEWRSGSVSQRVVTCIVEF
jgi:hypothetical protein